MDSIIEVKEAFMVSPLSGENPTHRTCYFIKPCMEETEHLPRTMFSSGRTDTVTSNYANRSLEVRYNGWYHPHEEWKTWVQQMQHKYQHLWMKAGIDQAIKASTFQIYRDEELILELAQRWCSKTNTFIFPWGEASITLEDMKVCWGYSVMGASFSSPLESDDEKEIEQELIQVFRMFFKSTAKRADHTPWMRHFMRNESTVEHEGFLSLWLSRFVFSARSHKSIVKSVFPIAIHLARGNRIALAPAVLASIYRDLSLLNNKIRTTTKEEVVVRAPFQVVQVWALERFPELHPRPYEFEQGQLVMAKWNMVKMLKHDKLNFALDSFGARNGFIWRPYENSPPLMLCNEKDMWMCHNPNFGDELESFGRCLRVSELVGMECVEQYCPNRIAMQFGMDQDIPGMLTHFNENPWISYIHPVIDTNLYSALCACHQPNVTSRYYYWWKQSNPSKEEVIYDSFVESSSEHLLPTSSSEKKEGEEREQTQDFDEERKLSIIELSSPSSEVRCFDDEEVGNGTALSISLSDAYPSSGVEGARSDRDDGIGINIENSCCERKGVSDMEKEDVAHRIANIASDLESRIGKLERVIAELKAKKYGP